MTASAQLTRVILQRLEIEMAQSPIVLSPEQARRKHVEDLLDEGLEETFPASDPVAIAVERAKAKPQPSGPKAKGTKTE